LYPTSGIKLNVASVAIFALDPITKCFDFVFDTNQEDLNMLEWSSLEMLDNGVQTGDRIKANESMA